LAGVAPMVAVVVASIVIAEPINMALNGFV